MATTLVFLFVGVLAFFLARQNSAGECETHQATATVHTLGKNEPRQAVLMATFFLFVVSVLAFFLARQNAAGECETHQATAAAHASRQDEPRQTVLMAALALLVVVFVVDLVL